MSATPQVEIRRLDAMCGAPKLSSQVEVTMGECVRLVPMSEAEFGTYEQATVEGYAEENVQAGYWEAEEALERARQSLRQILSQGIATPGHHFCRVEDVESGETVGTVWWFEDRAGKVPRAYVYYIVVEPRRRRRGYGSAALRAMEAEARGLGMAAVRLHVFAHNHAAIRAYERPGFHTTSLTMLKPLSS